MHVYTLLTLLHACFLWSKTPARIKWHEISFVFSFSYRNHPQQWRVCEEVWQGQLTIAVRHRLIVEMSIVPLLCMHESCLNPLFIVKHRQQEKQSCEAKCQKLGRLCTAVQKPGRIDVAWLCKHDWLKNVSSVKRFVFVYLDG